MLHWDEPAADLEHAWAELELRLARDRSSRPWWKPQERDPVGRQPKTHVGALDDDDVAAAVRVQKLECRALGGQASASSTGVGAVRAQSMTSARIRSRSRAGRQPIACRIFSIDGFRFSMSSIPCP